MTVPGGDLRAELAQRLKGGLRMVRTRAGTIPTEEAAILGNLFHPAFASES